MSVADLAILVVSAVDGIEVGTELAWERCVANKIPRLVFVNKDDKPRANFHNVLAALQSKWGHGFVPLELPLGEEESLHGVADVLSDQAFEYDNDGRHHSAPLPNEIADEEHRVHDELVEEIVSGDDDQLERYLSGDVPSAARIGTHAGPRGARLPRVPRAGRLGAHRCRDRSARRLHLRDRASTCRSTDVGDGRHRAGRGARRLHRPTAGVRVQDSCRPVRRSGLAVQGGLRHDLGRRSPDLQRLVHRGAPARPVLPARQRAAAVREGGRRRHHRGRQADQHHDGRHAGAAQHAGAGHRLPTSSPGVRNGVEAAHTDRRRQVVGCACIVWWQRTRPSASTATTLTKRCSAVPATPISRLLSSDWRASSGCASTPKTFACRIARRSWAPATPKARSRSSPAGTGSTRSPTCGSARWSAARDSSSSTRSSAEPSPATTCAPCRRGSKRR